MIQTLTKEQRDFLTDVEARVVHATPAEQYQQSTHQIITDRNNLMHIVNDLLSQPKPVPLHPTWLRFLKGSKARAEKQPNYQPDVQQVQDLWEDRRCLIGLVDHLLMERHQAQYAEQPVDRPAETDTPAQQVELSHPLKPISEDSVLGDLLKIRQRIQASQGINKVFLQNLEQIEADRAYLLHLLEGLCRDYRLLYQDYETLQRTHTQPPELTKADPEALPTLPDAFARFQPDVLVSISNVNELFQIQRSPDYEPDNWVGYWHVLLKGLQTGQPATFICNDLTLLPVDQQPEVVRLRWALEDVKKMLSTENHTSNRVASALTELERAGF